MFAPEHLLYTDSPVANPNIRIRLYRNENLMANFGACWLTPTQLEDGITFRVCIVAGVSGANIAELSQWHAVVEGNGVRLIYRLDKNHIFTAHDYSRSPN